MTVDTLPLVSDTSEVRKNIETYFNALEALDPAEYDARAIARMIPYVRSWYAARNWTEKLIFAPSKFIGYSGITAALYEKHDGLDGRVTEARLASWAEPIPPNDPRYADFHRELSAFCARFGAHPNAKARLAYFPVAKVVVSAPHYSSENGDDEHVQAILALIARMPPVAQERIRRGIGKLATQQASRVVSAGRAD